MESTKKANIAGNVETCLNATHVHQEFSRDGPVITYGNPGMGIVRPLADSDKWGRFV
jgi:hypothetical protein